jgi:polyisoprenoid-binding protein YceI
MVSGAQWGPDRAPVHAIECTINGEKPVSTTTDSATRTYKVDPTHSEVFFQVRHLVTKVRGRFSDFEGTINYNEASPEKSSVEFSIKTSSIDTSVSDRDTHLRSADFFSAEEHPTLTFRSKSIKKTGGESFDVVGDLSVRGTTKEIHLPVTFLGNATDPWGGKRIGFEAETTVNRKDYGLNWNAALETGGFLVGDDVKITLSIQAVAQ